MARKNVFDIDTTSAPVAATEPARPLSSRPLMGMDRPLKPAGAVGAISQSLGGISDKVQRAEEIERQLAQGQAVIELDPQLIDGSFVVDRLGVSAENQAALIAQIREHGQQVPILVRPNPDGAGRYQVAYGHRRLAAIRTIGGTVKAVVRNLSDEQLVISQGQENNARTDLTFIERSFFASKLEARDFSRDVIMSSLGVDKAALSRMIALVARLPGWLIEAIGSAPGFGRTRWAELADLLDENGKADIARKAVEAPQFSARSTDERFQHIYDLLRQVKAKARTAIWKSGEGTRPVRISETEDKLNLAFDKKVDPDFGAFVEARLASLYADYRKERG